MANFAQPILTTAYADFLQALKDRDDSIAKMFHGTTDTNITTGAVKYNRTLKRLEAWDGSAWQPDTIGNLAAGSVLTATIADDQVTAAKCLFANNTALRIKLSGGTTINAFGIDNLDRTVVNAGASKAVAIAINSTLVWYFDSGSFIPINHLTQDIGWSPGSIRNIYVQTVAQCSSVDNSGASMFVGPLTAHALILRTNNATRWTVGPTTGHLVPSGHFTDIGDASNTIRFLYGQSLISKSGTDLSVYSGSSANLYLGAGGVANYWTIPASESGTFRPVNTNSVDIGSSSIRVRQVYAFNFGAGDTAQTSIRGLVTDFYVGASPVFRLGAVSGSNCFFPLSTSMIGYPGAGSANYLTNVMTNQVTGFSDFNIACNGNTRFGIDSTGDIHITPGTTPVGSAGSLVGYIFVYISGTQRKIPFYAV